MDVGLSRAVWIPLRRTEISTGGLNPPNSTRVNWTTQSSKIQNFQIQSNGQFAIKRLTGPWFDMTEVASNPKVIDMGH